MRHYRGVGVSVLLILAAAIAVATICKVQMEAVVSPAEITQQLDSQGNLRPLADVISLTRTIKLVTVEVNAIVPSSHEDDSWRGRVKAETQAPVTYYYGVNLGELEDSRFGIDAFTRKYTLSVPKPTRLFISVHAPLSEKENVDASGLRLRSVAGETQLSLARLGLYDAAAARVLSASELAQIESDTLKQVHRLFAGVVGSESVEVYYR